MIKTPTLLTLALAGLLAAPFALQAQEPKPVEPGAGERGGRGGGRQDPAERLKMMKEKLSLTEEQTEKIKAVLEKTRGEMGKLREDQSVKPEDRRAKSQELRKAEMEEVKALLTPEQQEKLKDLRPAGGPGGDRPRGERGAAKPDAK